MLFLENKTKYIFLVLIFLFSVFFIYNKTYAAQSCINNEDKCGLRETGKVPGFIKDNEKPVSVSVLIGKIVGIFLSFLGTIFLILTIYGGFLWMTAGGSTDQTTKAKGLITNSVIGLIIILSAYAITSFVTNQLINSVSQ